MTKGTLLARASRRGAQAHIRHVSAVPSSAAEGRVADVYAQVERDFGMLAPPVSLHAPAAPALAACWVMLRETLVAAGQVDRAVKEAVAVAVSRRNSCPYCVEVHNATLYGLGGDAAAFADDRPGPIADPRLRAAWIWARDAGALETAGRRLSLVPAEEHAELIGVAVTFHYLNRMVNVFLSESLFPPGTPAALRGGLQKVAGRLMRRTALRTPAPGASLDLLPAAPLPGDLAWAAGEPNIAAAFARAAAAIESVGRRSVPEPVRELVLARLDGWTGEPPGLSGAWAGDAVAGLPVAERPAGRLALLTAMASFQVGESAIAEFRNGTADDAALVGLTSWASFAAARRVGALMATGGGPG